MLNFDINITYGYGIRSRTGNGYIVHGDITTEATLWNMSDTESASLDHDTTGILTKYVALIGLAMACMMTVGGNVAIILCVTRCKSLSKTNYSVYVLSLACADFIVGLVVQPSMVLYTYFGYWPFGNVTCTLLIMFDYCVCCISHLHLNAIAYDRLRSVADPLNYRANFTKGRSRKICITLWIGNVIFWGVPIVVTRILEHINGTMVLYECLYMPNKYYILSVSISFFYGLIIFLTITSVKLVIALRFADDNIRKTDSKSQPSTGGEESSKGKIAAQNMRVISTLAVLIVVFAICVGPWSIFWVILSFCSTCISDAAYEVSYWLSYANSFANPYMYFICNADFRAAIRQVLCGQKV